TQPSVARLKATPVFKAYQIRVAMSALGHYPRKRRIAHPAAMLIKGRNCHDHCCCDIQAPARNVSREMAREHQTSFHSLSERSRPDPQAISLQRKGHRRRCLFMGDTRGGLRTVISRALGAKACARPPAAMNLR